MLKPGIWFAGSTAASQWKALLQNALLANVDFAMDVT